MKFATKNYLAYENTRNQVNHKLYERLLRAACGSEQPEMVLIAHHLTFELPGGDPNEIPSADTLIFDHDIMKAVFGGNAMNVMLDCASHPASLRDTRLAFWLDRTQEYRANVMDAMSPQEAT